MKQFVRPTLLTTFMLLCVGTLVIKVIELHGTRNVLTYQRTGLADKRESNRQIEQDMLKKDEFLHYLYNNPVFLERVVRERLGYVKPEEWIFRFPQEEGEEEKDDEPKAYRDRREPHLPSPR